MGCICGPFSGKKNALDCKILHIQFQNYPYDLCKSAFARHQFPLRSPAFPSFLFYETSTDPMCYPTINGKVIRISSGLCKPRETIYRAFKMDFQKCTACFSFSAAKRVVLHLETEL